jgi:Cu-Zn family superoxide dismutase
MVVGEREYAPTSHGGSMRTTLAATLGALVTGALLAGPVPAQQLTATAELIDTEGNVIGQVALTETPNHGVHLRLHVEGLEAGEHGLHIHETGQCEAPGFDSAGGHYAPRGRSHGILHPHGKHAGDLVNLHVPASGEVMTERLAHEVTLVPGATGTLFDDDGSAIVIHATGDDYESQPAGAGGPKVACGVIRK